jgi:predicted MFS family arabinose efflux permease
MVRRKAKTTALSVPGFRRVWAGATVSAAGDSAGWVALVALALGPAHASLPLLVALYTAPVAIGGLAAGWALDRFDRRKLMIIDSLVRGAAFTSIPVAELFGRLGAGQLYAVAVVYGLFRIVGLAGFPTLIPSLVPEDQIDQANALEGVSYGFASLVGAGLAGLAVASVGPGPVVTVDALSYVVMALSLWSVRSLSAPAHSPGPRRGREAGAGFRMIARLALTNTVLRDTTIMFALFNIGDGALLVFLPHRALELGLGPGGYGYLVAATTAGEFVAGLFLSRWTWRAPLITSIIAAQVTAGLVAGLLVIHSAVVTVTALVAVGMCASPMTAWAQSLRMRTVSAHAHGRLFALLRTTMQATPPAGAALAGLTLGRGTLVTVVAIAVTMGVPAIVLAPDLMSVRRSPDGSPQGATDLSHPAS